MNTIKLISIFLLFSFNSKIDAQTNLTTLVKKIEFSSFDVNSPRTKQKDTVTIFSYVSITPKGLSYILKRDEDTDSLSYFKSQLDSNQLQNLNSIFNDNSSLKDYMTTQKLKKGEHFGGSYSFILVTHQDGKQDSLCFIGSFMSKKFNSAFKLFDNICYDKSKKVISKFKINQEFTKAIQLSYDKSSYLPSIENPPPPM